MHGIVSPTLTDIDTFAIRRTIVKMLHRGGASHVGPCMSMVEILAALFNNCDLNSIRTGSRDRDRIFVSKGHSAAALYAVMRHVDLLSDEELAGYHRDGSWLAGHVSHYVRHVEHSTGALGHGLSVACGCALGIRALDSRAFGQSEGPARRPLLAAVLGDGELQEGSVWEALMFARQHELPVAIVVDNNRISSITRTAEVMDLNPLSARFEGFGLKTTTLDGHDLDLLTKSIAQFQSSILIEDSAYRGIPHVFIANTVKGHGIPFAEHEPVWHYRPLSDEALADALAAIDEAQIQYESAEGRRVEA